MKPFGPARSGGVRAGVWAAFFLAMAPRRSRLRTILTQLRPSDAGGQPCKRFYDGESREREREREREKERERGRRASGTEGGEGVCVSCCRDACECAGW